MSDFPCSLKWMWNISWSYLEKNQNNQNGTWLIFWLIFISYTTSLNRSSDCHLSGVCCVQTYCCVSYFVFFNLWLNNRKNLLTVKCFGASLVHNKCYKIALPQAKYPQSVVHKPAIKPMEWISEVKNGTLVHHLFLKFIALCCVDIAGKGRIYWPFLNAREDGDEPPSWTAATFGESTPITVLCRTVHRLDLATRQFTFQCSLWSMKWLLFEMWSLL